jgi:hypothetical protein
MSFYFVMCDVIIVTMDTVLSSSIKLTFFLTQKIYIFLFIQLLKRQKKKGCALYINISVYSKQPSMTGQEKGDLLIQVTA